MRGETMIIETALICLALNVYHEARGETFEGKQAVASVTLNRARDARFPDTVCDVVKQASRNSKRPRGCAFSWYCDGADDTPRNSFQWAIALHVAHDAITGAFEDNTAGALWYHTIATRPIWRTRLTGAKTIGRHIFYNGRKKNTRF